MPSTHPNLHYHLIFSTKERRNLIAAGWRDRLHAYIGGTVRTLGGVPVAVGGTADHTDELRRYIANQEERHRSKTFQEEYVAFLRKNGVEYDERYLW